MFSRRHDVTDDLRTTNILQHNGQFSEIWDDAFVYACLMSSGRWVTITVIGHTVYAIILQTQQEAQLPQRNSASAAHMEGAKPSAHLPSPYAPSGYKPMHMVESETRKKLTSSVPSTKRTWRWIGHSRSFKVILIGAGRSPEWSVVVMCN